MDGYSIVVLSFFLLSQNQILQIIAWYIKFKKLQTYLNKLDKHIYIQKNNIKRES